MKRIIFLITLIIVFNHTIVSAITYYSRTSGNWDQITTWSTVTCGGVAATTIPASADTVIICNSDTVSLVANTQMAAITIDAGGVLDNGGKDLSLLRAFPDSTTFTINGEYTGGGKTKLLSGSNNLNGTGLVSTTGDWFFENGTTTIDIAAILTFSNNNNFIIQNDATLSCKGSITLNYGNITVSDGPGSINAGKYLKNSGGHITLTHGNLYIYTTGTALGLSVYNFSEGIMTVGGDIIGKNSTSAFLNNPNATLNIGGNLLSNGTLYAGSIGNTVNYTGSADQIIKNPSFKSFGPALVASTYYHLQCSNAGKKTLTANTIINGNLTIRDAAQLDVSATPYNIDLKGNWYDSSTTADPFIEQTGTAIFSGDTIQTITASSVPGRETFHNLIINNSDTGIVLNDNINITDTLTLLDGLIHTGADTVWVSNSDTAAIQGYSDTTYVNGYLKRGISPTGGSYDFPVGNAKAYALANVDFVGSDTIATLTVDFSNSAGNTGLPLTDANDAEYSTLLNCGGTATGTGNVNAGVWNIRPGKGSAIYDLSLYGRHFDNAGTMYHSIVKRANSSSPWAFAGTYLDAQVKPDTLIARRTCLTDFYQFAIATSNTSGSLNTTPISFSSPDNMICGSKCISFSSKNNFSATNWRWTLSGGAFATSSDTALQNPSNICFNDFGNYDVRLIASTACHADTLEREEYVRVNYLPTAAITAPDSVCSGVTADLSASPTGTDFTYLWSTTATTGTTSASPLTNTSYSVVVSTAFCSDTAFTTIAVTTTPTASIDANTTAICSGENVSLTSTGIADTYLWNTGESGTSITASPLLPIAYSLLPIRYSLRLSNGTCSNTDSIFISVTTTPTATITTTGATSICSRKRVILSAASAIQEITYIWNNGTTNQSINAVPLTNTTYSVVLSNGNCKDTAAIDINVTTTPTLMLTANRSIICSGESVALSATGAGDYLWSTGESGTSITASPPLAYSLSSVRYSLKLSNGSCSDTDSILITVVPMPTASISGPLTVCSGNSTGLSANPGDAYLWSTGETTVNIAITPLINTAYSVSVSNGSGLCTDTTSRSITLIAPVSADAGPDITIAIGLDTVLSANNGSAWNWAPKVRMDCNTCQNPIIAPFQTTSYTVTVTDIHGCISSDSVKVHVIPCATLYIPKAFSPNNDGQNDVLYIRGTDCIEKVISFTIFNRWGEKVFESFDIKTGWDGSQSKETLPNEVFIYYLDALSINGDAISKTGNVTLMR